MRYFYQLKNEFVGLNPFQKVFFICAVLILPGFFFVHQLSHAGIIVFPAARARDCGSVTFTTHEVIIKDGMFHPRELTAAVCDRIRFVNRESVPHEPAVGSHPAHTSYPGFDAESPLWENEIFEFTLNRPGTYSFHDHLNESMVGALVIQDRKLP